MTESEFRVSHVLNYCIINWNPEILEWEVLTYDMVFSRADKQCTEFKKTYPHCQLMVNFSQLKKEDAKQQLIETLERMKQGVDRDFWDNDP